MDTMKRRWLDRITGSTKSTQEWLDPRMLVLDGANPPVELFFRIAVGIQFYYHRNR